MQQSRSLPSTTTKFSVEVLTEEGLWAQHGSHIPNQKPKDVHSRNDWRRWGARGACAALTVVLHGWLLSSMLLGTAGRPRIPPLSDGAAASAKSADASEFVSTMIILNDHSIPDSESQTDSAYDVLLKTLENKPDEKILIAQLSDVSRPEISGSDDGKDADSPSIEATGDDQGRAMLFGRYMEQIKARIERAWDQPTTLASGKFQCRVEIMQGAHGEVKEVTLQRCNGNPAWQLSLVQAIQRASPLPAPPSENVFTSTFTLSFDATPQPRTVDSSNNQAPLIASSAGR